MRGIIFFVLTILSANVFAEHNRQFSVGGGIGQAFPTGPSTFFHYEEAKLHGSVWGRYFFTPGLAAEINAQSFNFNGKNEANGADATAFSLNGVYRCPHHHQWSPVAALGLGVGNISDYGTKAHNELHALIRYGIDYNFTPQLALGANAQFSYFGASSGKAPSELHALSYLLALSYSFGSELSHHQQEPMEKTVPAATIAPADADGDGVPDKMDKCPNTPAGAKVNAYGCQDKEKAQVRLNLTFPSGKSVIPDDQKNQIEEVAQFMKDYPSTKVTIEGHTDNTGREAVNKMLSEARAKAVKQSLIKDFGIAADRLQAVGYGSAKPIESNDTAAGREKNRRVVATINEN